jgi:hypothetical protein
MKLLGFGLERLLDLVAGRRVLYSQRGVIPARVSISGHTLPLIRISILDSYI